MGADVVFTGGTVFSDRSSSASQTAVTTVAVEAGRIAAIGGDEVLELADRTTEVVHLEGGLLIPGFQDAHVHPVQGGLERLSCDLSPHHEVSDYLSTIAAYAEANPDDAWILGGGWSLTAFPGGLPRRSELDKFVADRPVFLPNSAHHGAWVNTRALELAGITSETPDPVDGRIERDAAGLPTGMLHEGAMDLVGRLLPQTTREQEMAALLEAQHYLHSLGVTAWQDAILGSYANLSDASSTYQACADSGRLTAKVVGALWWDRSRGAEQIPELVERRQRYTTAGFRPTSVKIMQDGVPENFTAGMTTPYLDRCGHPTDNSGLSMVDPDDLCDYVTQLDRLGFQVHVHAIGDRAVRESLDAFEAARRVNGTNDNRHHIAHVQVIHPDDVHRFAALDVSVNMQPLWATHEDQMDDLTIPFLGAERAQWQYPFLSLARSGARLAAGSDWPVSSPNPLWGMHVAVNRKVPAAAGEVRSAFLGHQALDIESALTAYTAGSAYVNHLDDSGRIIEGAAADVVVLDRDILAGRPSEIGDATVQATYVDGVEVYRR